MAIRQINVTDSLETLRIEFNLFSDTDFGDIDNLDSSINGTSIVGAMNEVINIVGAGKAIFYC